MKTSNKFLLLFTIIITAANAAPTSNPNATQKTKELLGYLYSICGVSILSGQENMFSGGSFPSGHDEYVKEKTGKYPAVYASDFGDVGTGNLHDRNTVVSNAIGYHDKGSIISLQYHMIHSINAVKCTHRKGKKLHALFFGCSLR